MDERLLKADEALKAGRAGEAIDLVIEVLEENPDQPLQVYRVLVRQLYLAQRWEEGEHWAAKAVARAPKDLDLLNFHGVMLRKLGRQPEALQVFERAIKFHPASPAPQVNKGNVLLDMEEAVRAEAVWTQLVRREPRNPEHQRQLGRALFKQGKRDAAQVRWRQAVQLKKDFLDAWLDLAGSFNDIGKTDEAQEVIDRAIAANPGHPKLYEARIMIMRRAGQLRAADAYMASIAPLFPDAAWLEFQRGAVVVEIDRERGNRHLRRAFELDRSNPDIPLALIESLERTRSGDEGANIEEAYQLAREAKTLPGLNPAHMKILTETFTRVCAYDELDELGDFRNLGRAWASTGRHTALLKQLARVRSHADKLELLEQHRIWGRLVEKRAAEWPIKRPAPRPVGRKIRLGFMSSDLRSHPVAYFALPLFDHVDRERFEVFCYSYYQGADEDPVQKRIAKAVDGFRWWPDISTRDAAQRIAEDDLDILLELGGSTHMNKLEVMGYRPAPRQGSWLGYPHSAGIGSIDYFVCDPYSKPATPDLLIEQPLVMPHTWLALGATFNDRYPVAETLPADRNGFITFGTANNPHKYSREVLRLWAQVTASTPDARFAFIRPEGGTPSFRRNVLAAFAAEGVGEERVVFHTIRGAHLPFYNEVDITLDPFPLTGGTTTTETLWMGVPLVSLVGEAFYERLSFSILSNAGLADLCAGNLDDYRRIARELAADRDRRLTLRKGLREQIRRSPLGDGVQFARDFYDMIAKAVLETPAKGAKAAGG
jgi:predicted O-linked N-acetylglucosamine transferase (SPINDLY family)